MITRDEKLDLLEVILRDATERSETRLKALELHSKLTGELDPPAKDICTTIEELAESARAARLARQAREASHDHA